jgi:glycerophosphoryl diester phosphodiesterase
MALPMSVERARARTANSVSSASTFRVIGHRGAGGYAPENTRAAFACAKNLGCKTVETDLRLSADNVIVLCHDDTLSRYGHGEVRPEEIPASELLQLDAGSWFDQSFGRERFYTLDELLNEFKDSFDYELELKGQSPDLPRLTLEAIEREGLIQNTTLISFHREQLERARNRNGSITLGYLFSRLPADWESFSSGLDIHELVMHADLCTPEFVGQATAAGFKVRAWGLPLNHAECLARLDQLKRAGVVGATVDWPDWITA